MDLLKISDKEYHTLLRKYRNYLNGLVEENKKTDKRLIPVSFQDYVAQVLQNSK